MKIEFYCVRRARAGSRNIRSGRRAPRTQPRLRRPSHDALLLPDVHTLAIEIAGSIARMIFAEAGGFHLYRLPHTNSFHPAVSFARGRVFLLSLLHRCSAAFDGQCYRGAIDSSFGGNCTEHLGYYGNLNEDCRKYYQARKIIHIIYKNIFSCVFVIREMARNGIERIIKYTVLKIISL